MSKVFSTDSVILWCAVSFSCVCLFRGGVSIPWDKQEGCTTSFQWEEPGRKEANISSMQDKAESRHSRATAPALPPLPAGGRITGMGPRWVLPLQESFLVDDLF